MKYNENNGWLGQYEVITTYKDGSFTKEKINNRIMNVGLNFLRDGLSGAVTDLELKYLALGTSSTANSDTMTTLVAEGFRTVFTSQVNGGTGELVSTAIVLDSEAIFNIQEVGVFAGATATGTVNTGVLISRILYSRNKTNLESIQFVRTDTIGRA
jgi:hypothetical protein